jgi:hypothetical protein
MAESGRQKKQKAKTKKGKLMMTVNLGLCSDAGALREFSPCTLVALLHDHRAFLLGKGVVLPPLGLSESATGAALDYEAPAKVFQLPEDLPQELADRFHLVKRMSGPAQMDRILDEVSDRQLRLVLPADSSPQDVAALLLLNHRAVFEELHTRRTASRFRSFVFYVARRKRAHFRPPSSMAALERTLNGWYEAHQRARSARVFWREQQGRFWFYVRHAEPIKRDACVGLKDCESGSTIYRPERHDVVIYDANAGELQVHADSDGEAELFRLVFGLHLFDDGNYFPASLGKYDLSRLKSAGRASLACAGMDGLVDVSLTAVEFLGQGALGVRVKLTAADVFSSFEARGFGIPADAEIRMAKFLVRFRDSIKPRPFTVRPSNYATFSRDEDVLPLQAWLKRQGFVLPNQEETYEPWHLEYN